MNRNYTILHVDDDPTMLRIVAKTLGKNNYDVVSLEDPREATRALLKTGARVVLLDIDMPHLDGLTLLDEIKRQDSGVQVIMLTGLVSMTTVLQSMRCGAEACIFKPLTNFNLLLTAVATAFEKIDRWWGTLDDLNKRKSTQTEPAESSLS